MIRLLLRLYPPAWRARYGDELLDLLETTGGLTPNRAVDMLGQALRARAQSARRWVTAGGPQAGNWSWRATPWVAVFAFIALLPAALYASFGLAFTVLAVPVDPYVPLVRAALSTLPMEPALAVLPAAGLALVGFPLVVATRNSGGLSKRLAAAWASSPSACLIAAASAATLLFWFIDRGVV